MILLELALAPVIAIIIYFYYRDKYEKEPLKLLIGAFFCGFLITIPVAIVQLLLMGLFNGVSDFTLKIFLDSFLLAGLVEETAKFLIFILLIYNHKEFDEPFDAIIYAVMISLGFAAFENILYVFGAYLKGGVFFGFTTGFARALLSVPAHALFAVIMGYYLGIAKFSKNHQVESKNIFKALWVAIIMHGLFDFFIFARLALAFVYMLIGFLFCWRIAFRVIRIQVDRSPFKPEE
jgi:RsiW-degrading membrane proteinase PrsW (M82 family)